MPSTKRPLGSIDRRTLLMGGLGLTTAMLLPGIGRAAEGFKFITPLGYSLAFAPVLYAKSGGFYEKAGLDVEVIGGKGAAMAAQMTIAGQADSGRTGGANYIVSRVKNQAPMLSIATIAQASPFYVISPKSRNIAAVKDFEGKTFGMASLGGSMENTLDFMLSQGGVDPKSVNKVKVSDTPAAFGLIEANKIDGFMGNVSTTVKLVSTNADIHAFKVNDGIPGQVYVAAEQAIQDHPEKLIAFLKGTKQAAEAILDAADLNPILESIGSTFDIRGLEDKANAAADLKENSGLWISEGRENLLRNVPGLWEGGVKLMTAAGMIPEGVDPTSLYTNTLLDKA